MSRPVTLTPAALDALMPMHLALDSGGRIVAAGRALRRLAGPLAAAGRDFFDGFSVLRPCGIDGAGALFGTAGRSLVVAVPRAGRKVSLRGHLVAGPEGGILNLALALPDLPDLGGTDLTAQDFAPTDPTVDMLYLLEANHLAVAETHRLIDRLQGDKSRAEAAALSDALTGLGNRRALERMLAGTVRDGQVFALCHVDLDYFKAVNDSLGHAAGDAVLCEVARRLGGIVRAYDMVARVGGDEFVLVFPGLVDVVRLEDIASRIVAELERPVPWADRVCRISASIGISLSIDYDPPDPERMIADADRALYASKLAGRARHTFHGREGRERPFGEGICAKG